jgi:UDP-N-acetylmuramyl pentapeptide phosphotransferase/UDP-N-acetylglucosamine-1-phosphate transferase
MDGVDWMTIAEFVPMAVGLALIGFLGALPLHGIVVALALCGGLIGFAPFNRPVARIFLGDVGSLPIGLLFAWLLLLVAGTGHCAEALVLPLYYLADATLTLFRRIANREKVWQAHRTHFYQRATDRGWSVPDIVAHVFAVNAILVALAAASVLWPGPLGTIVALGGGAVAVAWLLFRFSSPKQASRS